MMRYVNMFLKTELTCIPYLIRKYALPRYNNAISNGIVWVFVIWCILHYCFAHFLNALFKRMCYKNYLIQRLNQSLWYLGFYTVALAYCSTTHWLDYQYRIELKANHFAPTSNLFWGFVLLVTFFAHSAVWEGVFNANFSSALNYLLLTTLLLNAYLIRTVETAFGITSLISIVHVAMELARVTQLSMYWKSEVDTTFIRIFFLVTVVLSGMVYCIALPFGLLLPLGLKIANDPSILIISFSLLLAGWLSTEIITLPAFRVINHWLYHLKDEKEQQGDEEEQQTDSNNCGFSILECCMFPPRDDESYTLKMLREDIIARQKSIKVARNPRKVFLQSIKCMLAVKRKINRRRQLSESSNSEESDNSESDKDASNEKEPLTQSVSNQTEDEEDQSLNNQLEEELDNSEASNTEEEVVDGKLHIRVSAAK